KRYFVPKVPADMSDVTIYLMTTARGDQIADRFGHTGIRVDAGHHGTDVVYNWGTYSFEDPLFAWRFFRGQLTYRFGVRSYEDHLAVYEYEGRTMWQDRLDLTAGQKRALLEIIARNALPENRPFTYQY